MKRIVTIAALATAFVFADAAKAANVLVILKEQAKLNDMSLLVDVTAMRTKVYQELVATAQATQGPIVSLLKKEGVSFRQHYIANAIVVENASQSLIRTLTSRTDVEKVFSDTKAPLKLLPVLWSANKVTAGIEENLKYIKADQVWSQLNVRGEGIVVAGQDTGIQWDHPALKNKYRGLAKDKNGKEIVQHTYSWHDAVRKPVEGVERAADNSCGYNSEIPCDDHGHGTHTLGTVLGDDEAGNQIGVAPGAKWIGCRNMDGGIGRPSTYLECFEFFLAPYPQNGDAFTEGKPEMAADVINNSWGCNAEETCQGDEMKVVLENLKAAGILVVASAGNEGPGCSTIASTPAHHTDSTLSVGAANHTDGSIAYFSSRGPSAFDGGIGPDVTAPGTNIRSATPGNNYEGGWQGTSMAGPHVVGQVALMWSANPKLRGQVDLTMDIIKKTARPKTTTQSCGGVAGSAMPNNTYGFGNIDVLASVKASLALY